MKDQKDHQDHPDLAVKVDRPPPSTSTDLLDHLETRARLEMLAIPVLKVSRESQVHQVPVDPKVSQDLMEKLEVLDPTAKMDLRENQVASDLLDQLVCLEPQVQLDNVDLKDPRERSDLSVPRGPKVTLAETERKENPDLLD